MVYLFIALSAVIGFALGIVYIRRMQRAIGLSDSLSGIHNKFRLWFFGREYVWQNVIPEDRQTFIKLKSHIRHYYPVLNSSAPVVPKPNNTDIVIGHRTKHVKIGGMNG